MADEKRNPPDAAETPINDPAAAAQGAPQGAPQGTTQDAEGDVAGDLEGLLAENADMRDKLRDDWSTDLTEADALCEHMAALGVETTFDTVARKTVITVPVSQ